MTRRSANHLTALSVFLGLMFALSVMRPVKTDPNLATTSSAASQLKATQG